MKNNALCFFGIALAFSGAGNVFAADTNNAPVKRGGAVTVTIISSLDGTEQKADFYCPPGAAPDGTGESVPLLVQLHTWSAGYAQCAGPSPDSKSAKIAPDFRGPNRRPEACASKLAIQDVLDAVEYAKKNARIDESRIYLSGWSGGGHMALMMAAKAPQVWAGVSAWVPISDLAAWRAFHGPAGYGKQCDDACGGPPGSPATDAEYKARSPINFLPAARGLPIDINAGIHDGHKGSVPISQSLKAFNVLAEANGFKDKMISEDDILVMTRDEKIPPALAGETEKDPERKRAILFRRTAGPVRITIFEGAHESEACAAWHWLTRQKKGTPADFKVYEPKGKGKTADAQEVGK